MLNGGIHKHVKLKRHFDVHQLLSSASNSENHAVKCWHPVECWLAMVQGTFAFALIETGSPGEPTTDAAHDHLDTWFLDLGPTVPSAYVRAILQCYS